MLAYPPGWTPIKTDPGTASVALLGGGERIDGYLNATPRQGNETLADWSRFRPATQPGRGRPQRASRRRHHRALSLGTRVVRDRHLHDVESQLPRDRLPRVRPRLERGGGGRGSHRAVGPAGRHAAASRIELYGLSNGCRGVRQTTDPRPPQTMTALSPPQHPAGLAGRVTERYTDVVRAVLAVGGIGLGVTSASRSTATLSGESQTHSCAPGEGHKSVPPRSRRARDYELALEDYAVRDSMTAGRCDDRRSPTEGAS